MPDVVNLSSDEAVGLLRFTTEHLQLYEAREVIDGIDESRRLGIEESRVHHDLCYAVPCTKGGTSDVTVSRSSHPYQRGVGFDELDRGRVDRAGPRV